MSGILFHVKFEGELSVSILKNQPSLYKKVGLNPDEFQKLYIFQTPPLAKSMAHTGSQVIKIIRNFSKRTAMLKALNLEGRVVHKMVGKTCKRSLCV
jgi:predicted glycosyltransferase